MCRQMAYLGPARTLQELVLQPEHSLLHQSYAPRHQRHGTVNADGFGLGWYDLDIRPEPAVYRRPVPVWSDRSLLSMAPMIRTTACVAAVRDATTGSFVEESSTAPFSDGTRLFAHNGLFRKFDGKEGVWLRRSISDKRLPAIRGTSDSEFLFALVLDRIDEGESVKEAMSSVISDCLARTTGAFNFLLHEGSRFTATVCGDSLYLLQDSGRLPGGVVVASEPYDDDPAWQPVADSSIVEAFDGRATVATMGKGA